ncbi:uncharacterized protein BO95DRAFT_254270 [Aspergillus brunneoviolaceus CBS 621.78]|uniref:Uncharacterized protein n=1 Tax=Aspergillus brunneoviolaceus CBS 621.78 TaxID=1450534 RepID=A0ACD1FY60_9EURO|nr:hypothetical protein BO95DRAFT_254270 [Aspergillus brunneoviolaceus CBS 621.78]RAH41895.1 hypothetical protein BO95DRAFT_254270 [Aspergillus brunneoviolaceus CBS 621.78]
MAGEAILSFAGEIQKQVQADDHEDPSLLSDAATSNKLDSYLSHLPISTGTSSSSIRRRLNHAGTELWNSCTQRMTNCSDPTTSVVLCKVKAFAWAMLDTAVSNRSIGSFRVLETAYKLIKTCIEHDCVAISLKIIEAVAMRLDALAHLDTDVDEARLRQCNVHYYALRVHLAWIQGRLDIADHLFLKLPDLNTGDCCALDVCFKVGSSALSCRQYDVAAKWLERGLQQCKLLVSSSKESDVALRNKALLILHALVRANIYLDTHDSRDNLARALEQLKSLYSNVFSIRLLELEVLARGDRDVEQYFQVLQDALKAVDASESSFRMILYYIDKLQDSPEMYFHALERLLTEMTGSPRLDHEHRLLEHVFVRLVDALTNPCFSAQASLRLFKEVVENLNFDTQFLSVEAQQACLMIVWKHINRAISDHDALSAEQWCLFMLKQPVIPLSSDTRSKLFRRLILCASETLSTTAADTLFNHLPEECRHCPLTLYLMYKLTLWNNTCTSSFVYMQALFELVETSSPYIISCIAEAFRQGKMIEALQCLQQTFLSKEGLQLDNQTGRVFQSSYILSLNSTLAMPKMKG